MTEASNKDREIESGAKKPAKKQSRQDRRVKKTQKRIIEAARSLISEKGLEATTVDDITERADLGRGTFYYHFDNKDELVKDLIGEVMSSLIREMEVRCGDESDLSSVMEGMIQAHTNYFAGRWEDFSLYYLGQADLILERSYEGIEAPYLSYLRTIEKMVDSTVTWKVSTDILRRVAYAIGGFISGYYSFASIVGSAEEVEESFGSLKSAFVAGLVRFIKEAMPEGERTISKQDKLKQ
jgi:AcrR family transcriptional regulator